jgi:curved DNA-binding protein CbpA
MTVKTLYTVLGVPSSALPQDIEDAFNRLKLQYPKEKLEADDATRIRFLALQQAYETLSNPDARAVYDQKLAKAGVKVNPQAYGADVDAAGWLSTRNIIVAGLILILISGMWVYHARQKAREQREAVDRVLRMAEEEKRRAAEMQASQEERRQAQLQANEERQKQIQERQFRMDAERAGHQVTMQQQNAERQAAYQRQREEAQAKQQAREQQFAAQAAERAAQQRIREDQAKLRALCRERYGRTDC